MANSIDPDETAHYEPSHLDLHCLQKYLSWSNGLAGLTQLLYVYAEWILTAHILIDQFSQGTTKYNKTCMTSKDSDQPVHPPSIARVLV